MSTTDRSQSAAARRPESIALTGQPGVPFGRLVKAELRKLTDTRAGRWLLIAILALTPVIIAIMLITAAPKDLTYGKLINFTQTPQKILLPMLGILTITSEWSQRTGLVTFTLTPQRGRVLLAKATATGILGLVVIALAFGAAAVGNLLGVVLRNGNGSWAFGAGGFRDITIVQLTGLAQGLAFGMLLLSSAAAIAAYYLLPNLSSFLVNVVPALKGGKEWFDLNSAQSALYTHEMTGHAWVQLLVAVLIWVILPLALGVLRVLRSEISSS